MLLQIRSSHTWIDLLTPFRSRVRSGVTAESNGMARRTFVLNRERAVDYLNMLDRLYVFDGFAGWDPEVWLWTIHL